ncbi:MAG: LL-diaminopimelate aminotransferase [Candidatus Atribacteria bacterium]|nr:LL-diaminopimelate aminotransferase [Candidatus Atribacteria bacterium]MCD6350440.1 LL-diaminopimelate aminotransferase [Candidatus Atribacteria bacterium]
MEVATRIRKLPPYLFAQIEQKIAEEKEKGREILDLGIGDPDLPTPSFIVDKLCEEARKPQNHRYPSYRGLYEFRKAVAEWYLRRFGVKLDPEREVVSLIGSKEGIAHFAWCAVDPGDIVLASDPGYPVYKIGSMLAGGIPLELPLLPENDFLPDFSRFPQEVLEKTRLVFINYPNNPTSQVASLDFFKEVVELARRYNFIIAHDLAYSEIAFDGYRAPSILEVEGAREVAIEFHSLSKTFNMTGWRIGFAVGNEKLIEALGRIKTNVDSGIFNAIQWAGVEALSRTEEVLEWLLPIYQKRRDLVVRTLSKVGIEIKPPKATLYVWIPIPLGFNSLDFANFLLDKAGVVVTPGIGFGRYGEGFVRISLTTPDAVLEKAMNRVEEALRRY